MSTAAQLLRSGPAFFPDAMLFLTCLGFAYPWVFEVLYSTFSVCAAFIRAGWFLLVIQHSVTTILSRKVCAVSQAISHPYFQCAQVYFTAMFFFFFFIFLNRVSLSSGWPWAHCIAQSSLKFATILPQSCQCWDYRHVPLTAMFLTLVSNIWCCPLHYCIMISMPSSFTRLTPHEGNS